MGRFINLLLKAWAFPHVYLANRIILALQNLPLSYAQRLWCLPDATSAPTYDKIPGSSVLCVSNSFVGRKSRCETCQEYRHSQDMSYDSRSYRPLGKQKLDSPIPLIGLHPLYR